MPLTVRDKCTEEERKHMRETTRIYEDGSELGCFEIEDPTRLVDEFIAGNVRRGNILLSREKVNEQYTKVLYRLGRPPADVDL